MIVQTLISLVYIGFISLFIGLSIAYLAGGKEAVKHVFSKPKTLLDKIYFYTLLCLWICASISDAYVRTHS